MSSKSTYVASASTSNGSISENATVDSKIEVPKDDAEIIWEHGISIDGENAIQCKYCDEIITGGLYRFAIHLLGSEHGSEACRKDVNDEVDEDEGEGRKCVEVGKKRKGNNVGGESFDFEDIFKKKTDGALASGDNKNEEEACRAIARFFYNNLIPMKAVKSMEFVRMCDMVSRCGVGFVPPSFDEIKGKYLREEVKLVNKALDDHHRVQWKKTGCCIMVDGWTDKKKRSILNLLVNSLNGTFFLKSVDASDMMESPEKLFKMMDDVVEEVGEENVVQVVTDNTTYFKAAGEMLMEKRTRLYWTPCATHCIEMMLEDYEKKIPVYEEIITKGKKITDFISSRDSLISLLHKFTEGIDLVRQGITSCATTYLTLDRLHETKEALRRMFTSMAWKSSQFAKTSCGKFVEDVVLDKEFWKNVMICLNGANPLLDVLRLVNTIDEPATGFIYEAMEKAKDEIRRGLSEGGTER
ncbi:uncharacterized protein [Medicago truncatula]|uniref:uncharacterized protein n=1 Tax=Medicago truncatula TaxID=3880 RepID=UPI001966F0D4|nr:uncharacterized protein LOC120575856 [Medicago truncatula]